MSSEEFVDMLYNRKRKRTTSVAVSRSLKLKGGAEDLNEFDDSYEKVKVDLKKQLGRNPTNLETLNFLLKVYEEGKVKTEAVQVKVEPDLYQK